MSERYVYMVFPGAKMDQIKKLIRSCSDGDHGDHQSESESESKRESESESKRERERKKPFADLAPASDADLHALGEIVHAIELFMSVTDEDPDFVLLGWLQVHAKLRSGIGRELWSTEITALSLSIGDGPCPVLSNRYRLYLLARISYAVGPSGQVCWSIVHEELMRILDDEVVRAMRQEESERT